MKKRNRLETYSAEKQKKKEKLFCAYITMGFPHRSFSERLIPALEKSGVDILELGIPFSDPLADGPVIQDASHVALQHNFRVHDAFTTLAKLRRKGLRMPVIFFSYYNIIFNYGINAFVKKIKQSGFDGVLSPDLPPEENRVLERALRKAGLSLVYLVAPTTPPARMKELARKSSGFIYYVSRRGVTGLQKKLSQDLGHNLRLLKRYTKKSVLVGFGVSHKKHIADIVRVSDGVIVGSAIIKKIQETRSVQKTAHYVAQLVRLVKHKS